MQKRIKLLALDLDGTLLDNEKRISRKNEECIRAAMERGVFVVPVTGRPKAGILESIEDIFRESYMITSNGAVTTHWKSQVDVDSAYMTKEQVLKILNLIKPFKNKAEIEIFSGGIGYLEYKQFEIVKDRYQNTPLRSYINQSRAGIIDLKAFVEERPHVIAEISIMTASKEVKEEICLALRELENLNIICTVGTDLEITAAKAEKGLAVLRLAKQIGIDRNEILACGDSGNDYGMIRNVGIGVAMENADPHLKEIADFITLSNENSGVAYAINRFILENKEQTG